jgi:hypothetical protein
MVKISVVTGPVAGRNQNFLKTQDLTNWHYTFKSGFFLVLQSKKRETILVIFIKVLGSRDEDIGHSRDEIIWNKN